MTMIAGTEETTAVATIDEIWSWLASIPDPEVPAISIVDLGIVRDVRWSGEPGGGLVVALTPTYSGCPAMGMIAEAIVGALRAHGIPDVEIRTVLSPAWTTDWLSADAKARLRRYGIAPPVARPPQSSIRFVARSREPDPAVTCPRCGSSDTECISAFGSTACKAQHRCRACLEPFDYFKPM